MKLPEFESLDTITIQLMMRDMPPAFLPIIEVIGLKGAMKLVNGFAGQVFVMPKGTGMLGHERFKGIAAVIGIDAAFQLQKHFGGEKLIIPNLEVVKRKFRNRSLTREFDAMIKTSSSSHCVNVLATRYKLTSRQVELILGGKSGNGSIFYGLTVPEKGYTPKPKPPAIYGSKR